jgi:predicted outer membrane repeat protein
LAQNGYLVNLNGIDGQTITLDPNLGTLELDSNFNFYDTSANGPVQGVTIERKVAQGAFGLFEIAEVLPGQNGAGSGVQVAFTNVTFQGGKDSNGGAILIDNPTSGNNFLTLTGCDLINNTATNSGGAIAANQGAVVSLTNTILSLNSAQSMGVPYMLQW